MKIKCAGIGSDGFLYLSTQTNPGKVLETAHFKARAWALKKAKSYTIFDIVHTDYHGIKTDRETGYSSFKVSYYTTIKEGETKL